MVRRLKSKQKRETIEFTFNGRKLVGLLGEPIASALLVNEIKSIRVCEVTGEERGVYCGIGHCFECRAEIDGVRNVRTCLTPLKENMVVRSETSS